MQMLVLHGSICILETWLKNAIPRYGVILRLADYNRNSRTSPEFDEKSATRDRDTYFVHSRDLWLHRSAPKLPLHSAYRHNRGRIEQEAP